MATEIPDNIYDICRLCSATEGNKFPIFGDDEGDDDREPLSYRIKICVNVTVCVDDSLSTQICEPCLDLVTTWYRFKQDCSQAQETQKKWLRLSAVPNHLGGNVVVKSEPVDIDIDEDEEVAQVESTIDIKHEALDISDEEGVLDLSVERTRAPVSIPMLPRLIPIVKRERCEFPSNIIVTSGSGSEEAGGIEEVNLEATPKKKYKCSVCDKLLASRGGLAKHKQIHVRSVNNLQCLICSKEYLSPFALTEHMKTHKVGMKPFSCSNCNKECSGEDKLRKHIARCNPRMGLSLGGHTCSSCNKTFPNETDLNVHMISHTATCRICSEIFPNSLSLDSHMRSKHSGTKLSGTKLSGIKQGEPDIQTVKKSYACSYCTCVFPHWYQLKKHINLHETRQIPSSVIATEPPPVYKCKKCPQTFGFWKEFVDHNQTTHILPSTSAVTVPKPVRHPTFSCTSCQVTFPRFQAFAAHQENVHGRQAYDGTIDIKPINVVPKPEPTASPKNPNLHSCHVCLKTFSFSSLARHVQSHTTDKRYACPMCHIRMKYPYSVQKHLLTKHNIQYDLSQIKVDISDEPPDPPAVPVVTDSIRRSFTCQMCNKRFYTEDAMRTHQQAKHKDVVSTKCKFCTQMFRRAEDLRNHESTHVKVEAQVQEKPFKCPMCPLSYRTNKTRVDHQRKKDHFPPENTGNAINSFNTEIKIKIFTCTLCHNSYNNEEGLRIHRQKKHGLGTGIVESSLPVPLLTCDICKTSFSHRRYLVRHKRHAHAYPYKQEIAAEFTCPTCSKTFETHSALTSHRGWHAREDHTGSQSVSHHGPVGSKKQKNCHICNKEFLTPEAFKIHIAFCRLTKTANMANPKLEPETMEEIITPMLTHRKTMSKTMSKMKVEIPIGSASKKRRCRPAGKPSAPSLVKFITEPTTENGDTTEIGNNLPDYKSTNGKGSLLNESQKGLSCPHCSMTFASIKSRTTHIMWHSRQRTVIKPEPKECIHCKKMFYRPGNLQKHMLICTERTNDAPVTQMPNEDFNNDDNQINEMLKCSHCSKKFYRPNNLKNHLLTCRKKGDASKTAKNTAPILTNQRRKPEPQVCIHCDKVYYRSGYLEKHLRSCPSATKSAEVLPLVHAMTRRLKRQRKVSLSISLSSTSTFQISKPRSKAVDNTYRQKRRVKKGNFPCDICLKSFTVYRSMQAHRMWHTRHNSKPDPILELAAKQPSEEEQEKSKEEVSTKMFLCDFCSKPFPSNKACKMHRRFHLRKLARSSTKTATLAVHPCTSCSEVFNSYSKLSRHRQKHIREIFPANPEDKVKRVRRRRKKFSKPQLNQQLPELDAERAEGVEFEPSSPSLSPAPDLSPVPDLSTISDLSPAPELSPISERSPSPALSLSLEFSAAPELSPAQGTTPEHF